MENKLQTLAGCSIFEQHVLDYFYTGNSICLYRATCGAIPSFEKSQNGKYSETRGFVQGAISPCGTGAYPRSL